MAVRACEACKRVRGGRRHGADACATSVAGKHERDASRHTQLLRRHTHLACLHLPWQLDLATRPSFSLREKETGKESLREGESPCWWDRARQPPVRQRLTGAHT